MTPKIDRMLAWILFFILSVLSVGTLPLLFIVIWMVKVLIFPDK